MSCPYYNTGKCVDKNSPVDSDTLYMQNMEGESYRFKLIACEKKQWSQCAKYNMLKNYEARTIEELKNDLEIEKDQLNNCSPDTIRDRKWEIEIIERIINRKEGGGDSGGDGGGCYIATCVYGSYDCPEVWTLRRFRDGVLARTFYGRLFIRAYYAISPTFVKWFGKKVWFSSFFKPILDMIIAKLQSSGTKSSHDGGGEKWII